MTYESPAAFRQALLQRLNAQAVSRGVAAERLHVEVVFERLLARLIEVAPDRWVVKGGLALDCRFAERARMTRDMDLAWRGHEDEIQEMLLSASEMDLYDHFTFTIARDLRRQQEDADVRSIPFRVRADLAGTLLRNVAIDVGVGDPLLSHPETAVTPGLLEFAGFGRLEIPVLPIEQHIAEKVHAYTRTFASGPSSRVKDLIDIVLIATMQEGIDAGRLVRSLQQTFMRRGTHALPSVLTAPPSDWSQAYRETAARVGLDERINAGFALAGLLIDPLLIGAIAEDAEWGPDERAWKAKP